MTTIQGVFTQEKLLNLGKESKFCGVLTCPFPMSRLPSSSVVALETTCDLGENQQPGSHWGYRPSSQRTVIILIVCGSQKTPLISLVFIWPDSKLTQNKSFFCRAFDEISVSIFYSSNGPKWRVTVGYTLAKPKRLKGNTGGKAVFRRFVKFWHIPGTLEGHMHTQSCIHAQGWAHP